MAIIDSLMAKFAAQMQTAKLSAKKAQDWFQKKVKTVTGNDILGTDRARLIPKGQLNNRLIGRMVLYFYDPKTKDELPYYDRFPMTIIIKYNKDGFLGLNLHYLPYDMRAKLLDGLDSIYKGKQFDEKKKLRMSYDLLKQASRLRYYKPCLKRYLYSHVRSQFYVVDPAEWEMVLSLPIERFEKQSKTYVWNESRKMLGMAQGKRK